jgi:hypothetical protein
VTPRTGLGTGLAVVLGSGIIFLFGLLSDIIPPSSPAIAVGEFAVALAGAALFLGGLLSYARVLYRVSRQRDADEYAARPKPIEVRRIPGMFRIASVHAQLALFLDPPVLFVDDGFAARYPAWYEYEIFRAGVLTRILSRRRTFSRVLTHAAFEGAVHLGLVFVVYAIRGRHDR